MKQYTAFFIAFTAALNAWGQPHFGTVPPQQSQRELNILKAALTSLHPGIYRYESPQQVDSLFSALSDQTRQPVREDRYFILISRALTSVHCGHTYTNYWNQGKAVTDRLFSRSYLPFLFRMIGKQMIVTHNLSGNRLVKPGDEIRSVNGIPSKQIIDSLLTVSPSDGLHGLARKLDNISIEPLDADTAGYNLFDIYFPLFFPRNFDISGYSIRLKRPGSSTFKVTLSSLTKAGRLKAYNDRNGILPVHEKNWSLQFLDNRTACFKIGDFETWGWKADYRRYLDSLFNLLNKRRIKNLVVDIRGNSGGDDAARDEVFSYLTGRPFGCDDPMHRYVRCLSIPDTLLPYLKTWDKTFNEPKNPADYVRVAAGCFEKKTEIAQNCAPVQSRPNRFKGRKYLITDGRNGSTTFTLAKMFRTYRAGEIIGETTGGNQQGINGGQFFFLYLPYSKIEIDIPLVWGAYSGARPDTGIRPDKTTPLSAASIFGGSDPAIKFVLDEIRRSP